MNDVLVRPGAAAGADLLRAQQTDREAATNQPHVCSPVFWRTGSAHHAARFDARKIASGVENPT
jgi:hypothetical protein